MTSVSRRCVLVVVAATTLFGAIASVLRVSASHTKPIDPRAAECGCDDLPDLIDRLHEVEAARKEIGHQTAVIRIAEAKAGHRLNYSRDDYVRYFTDPIQNAMDAVADKNAHRIKGRDGIDPGCGSMLDVALATSCLRPIIAEDEQYADQACKRKLDQTAMPGDRGGIGSNWLTGYALTDIAGIEDVGYLSEIFALETRITEVLANCKYPKWSGKISVNWTRESKVDEKLPRPGQSADSGTGDDVTDNKYEFLGYMYIVNGEPRANAEGFLTVKKGRNVSGKVVCHSGMLGGKSTPISISQTSTEDVNGRFAANGSFNVSSIDALTGSYTVHADFNGGYGSGAFESDLAITGDCNDQKPSHDTSAMDHILLDGVHVSGRGTAKPNALEIHGSADCGKAALVIGSTTQTLTCTLVWDLERTRAQ